MSNWGCNFHPPKSGEYLGPSNPPCICSFWSSPNSSAAAPQWKPLLVAPIAQTQHCFVSSLEMPPFNGRTSCFFFELLVFPSIIFEGGFLFSFPGSELKTTCFWESCFLCFHWNLSFNEMIWNKKKSTNLGSTLHPGCHKFLDLRLFDADGKSSIQKSSPKWWSPWWWFSSHG